MNILILITKINIQKVNREDKRIKNQKIQILL